MGAAALTVTVLEGDPNLDVYAGGILNHSSPLTIKCAWTSDGSGDCALDIASTYSAAQVGQTPRPSKIRGYLARVVTDPAASTDDPSADYDVYLKDPGAIDIALAGIMDRSASANQQVVPTTTVWVDHEITLVVDNAGADNKGIVYLYLVP
jgi:hypothetical protein